MIWQVLLTPSLPSLVGGGTFVLKFTENGSFNYNQRRSFSASYGGVVYLTATGSTFEINSIDGMTLNTSAAKRAEIFWNTLTSSGSTQTFIIPFGSSCILEGTSGNYAIEYILYKYELIQS